MLKKITYILLLISFTASCAGTLDSVKRGLTGQKKNSSDEFLIKKKDPLILPPDYENLPSPDERKMATEEITIFEEKLGESIEEASDSSSTTEESILKEIKKR